MIGVRGAVHVQLCFMTLHNCALISEAFGCWLACCKTSEIGATAGSVTKTRQASRPMQFLHIARRQRFASPTNSLAESTAVELVEQRSSNVVAFETCRLDPILDDAPGLGRRLAWTEV